MSSRYNRRTFVRGAAASTTAFALFGGPAFADDDDEGGRGGDDGRNGRSVSRAGTFRQGVASGQPTPTGITLWTRLSDVERSAGVGYEVATDRDFRGRSVVARGRVTAERDLDFTARVRVEGRRALQPGEEYFYRFFTRNTSSRIGRFHTARPPGSREPVKVAFWSCQEYVAGFYYAHRDLARRQENQDIDLVVCLGDYIYEQVFADQASVSQPVREDNSTRDGEAELLSEYRNKYNLYHSDEDLLDVRASYALMSIWDDHEVEDNYADGLPGGASVPPRKVPFAERKRNGYRAWYEHQPRIVGAPAAQSRERIYGSVDLGNAEVFLLDTRQYRDDQPCNPNDSAISNKPCRPNVTDDPSRTLLGRQQKEWLLRGLKRSTATWKVVANQVMIMSLDAPPTDPLNTDSWDGYGAERKELIDFIAEEGIRDVSFVTGDIHTFFAGDVTRTGRLVPRPDAGETRPPEPRATEFVGGSITSPGIVDRVARDEASRNAAAAPGDAFVLGNNPHIRYSNQAYKGYGVLEAGQDELRVEYRAARETRDPEDRGSFTLRRFRVVSGQPRVIDEGNLPGAPTLPPPAPPLRPGDPLPFRTPGTEAVDLPPIDLPATQVPRGGVEPVGGLSNGRVPSGARRVPLP